MKRYFSSIKQYSWIVLACAVLATVAGLLLARTQPTVYQTTSVILVQVGAPGSGYPGGPAVTGTSADSLGQALNYAAQIPTRSVMEYVLKFDPTLQKRRYTADDLILDVIPSTSTTVATISVLATAIHPADAVLIANDVAKGFVSYNQSQSQQHLDASRQMLISQITSAQQQKQHWEAALASLPNNTVPQYTVDNNNLADATRMLDALQTQLQALPTTVVSNASVIQTATSKDVSTSPKGLIITAVTGGVGLVIGILIMLLVIFLDNRLRNDEQVSERLGLAYLGSLSSSKELNETPTNVTGPVLHEVSDILANLRLTGILPTQMQSAQGVVLLLTSPQAAEGKTTLTAALAASVARNGGNVAVLDGNLQQPSTHLAFGVTPAGIGLSGLLKSGGKENLDYAVQRTDVSGVWLLPGGVAMDDATLLLEHKLPEILMELRKKVNLVIIDGPALLNGAGASQLANMVDGVALVIDARHERFPTMVRARNLLSSLTHTPTGIIMNQFTSRSRNGYYASPYRGNATSEQWLSVQAHANNGNGQQVRPEIVMPIIRTSLPYPPNMVQLSGPPSSPPPVIPSDLHSNVPMMQQYQPWLRPAANKADGTPPPSWNSGKGE